MNSAVIKKPYSYNNPPGFYTYTVYILYICILYIYIVCMVVYGCSNKGPEAKDFWMRQFLRLNDTTDFDCPSPAAGVVSIRE